MVTVAIRQTFQRGSIFYYEPAVVLYIGTLIPNSRMDCSDCITLQTNDQLHIVPKRDIVGVPPVLQDPVTINYLMHGSKGDVPIL